MIAAASSGSGKTMITCALLQILKDEGLNPVAFKCGPDYIDPMFHRKVLGIDSKNLDTFLAGPNGVRSIVSSAAADEHFAVIEGVMGIYDGLSPASDEGSCYEIARITNTPIILVVNAAGIGRTIISLIKGILADDSEHLIRGIILNKISDAFYEKLRPYLHEEIAKERSDVAILGHIGKCDDISLDSRHLGLKMPDEIDDFKARICRFAKIMQKGCDLKAILDLMDSGAAQAVSSKTRSRSSGTLGSTLADRTLAVARDEAFCFYYPENLEFLEDLGMKIVYFSPIHDEKVPEGADALLLGGGYPELYLEELAGNESMLRSVRQAIENGKPSVAECGGFMYLHKEICDKSSKAYKMAGVIDGKCRYTGHLVNFGYMQIADVHGPVADDFRKVITGLRGHEFHYYESTAPGDGATIYRPNSGQSYEGMYIDRNRLWGWPHLYYRSKYRI